MSVWRPISTVPRDGTPVLVWLSKPHFGSQQAVAIFTPSIPSGVIGGCFGFNLSGKPLMWQLLPAEPSPCDLGSHPWGEWKRLTYSQERHCTACGWECKETV